MNCVLKPIDIVSKTDDLNANVQVATLTRMIAIEISIEYVEAVLGSNLMSTILVCKGRCGWNAGT